MEVGLISKERDCKRNLVRLDGFGSGKIVFILLTKVIALYMRLITINVRGSGLEFDLGGSPN